MTTQVNLGELIKLLKQVKKPKTTVRFNFAYFKPTNFQSYRGYHDHLALGWEESDKEITVAELLTQCRLAVNKSYAGYKGGEYTMTLATPLWVANRGNCHNTAIVGIVDVGWQVIIETTFKE